MQIWHDTFRLLQAEIREVPVSYLSTILTNKLVMINWNHKWNKKKSKKNRETNKATMIQYDSMRRSSVVISCHDNNWSD